MSDAAVLNGRLDPPSRRLHRESVEAAGVRGLRLIIVARNRLTRYGLATMLAELDVTANIEVMDTVEEAIAALIRPAPGLLVITTDMSMDEYLCLAESARSAGKRVLSILRDSSREEVERAARFAADAYLLEQAVQPSTILNAVTRVASGAMVLPESLARELLATVRRQAAGSGGRIETLLTPREKQTLSLLVDGMSNKQIALQLGITQHGVKRHVTSVLAKLNCPNRTHAVAVAVREGLCAA